MERKLRWIWIGMMAILILSACNIPQPSSTTPTIPPLPTTAVENGAIPATGESCLVGSWVLDNNQFETGWIESRIRRLTNQQLNIREISGRLVVQFLPDGQVIGYAQSFDLLANLQARGARIPIQAGVDGSIRAAYHVDDTSQILTLTGPVTGWEDVNVTARALIIPVFSGTASELIQSGLDTDGSVELETNCSGDTLQITVDEEEVGRKTFRLDRAP